MGDRMQFVFTDIAEAEDFLVNLRPPIVDYMKTIHLEWGVCFIPSRQSRQKSNNPKRSSRPYVQVWQFATSLPRIREVVLWVDWLNPGDKLSMIEVVRYADGEIVQGRDDIVKKMTRLPADETVGSAATEAGN